MVRFSQPPLRGPVVLFRSVTYLSEKRQKGKTFLVDVRVEHSKVDKLEGNTREPFEGKLSKWNRGLIFESYLSAISDFYRLVVLLHIYKEQTI